MIGRKMSREACPTPPGLGHLKKSVQQIKEPPSKESTLWACCTEGNNSCGFLRSRGRFGISKHCNPNSLDVQRWHNDNNDDNDYIQSIRLKFRGFGRRLEWLFLFSFDVR